MDMNMTSSMNTTSPMGMNNTMGHDMDMGMGSCLMSMYWNWYTIDACFLAESWHIRSKGAFAGSVIGVFLLVALVEGVRRTAREYDRKLLALARARVAQIQAAGLTKDDIVSAPLRVTPTFQQQIIRAGFFGVQFTVAYIVMLLAMYYNGYILMAICIGGTAGYFVFSRDTLGDIDSSNHSSCC